MSKKIIKAVVLLLVFLVTVVSLSLLTDQDNVDLTSEMPEATLPVVFLQKENVYLNELFGYKGEMDAGSIRDTITPLSKNMRIPVTIQAFQTHVEGISFEVRTMDMQRLLQNTQIDGYTQKDGMISTELAIENLLEEEQEYRLILTLECDGEAVRYYTRIIRADSLYVDESIRFALEFHDSTFHSETAARLASYMEPNAEGDNTTLQKVTIHSSLRQVAWNNFEGEVLQDPIPSVLEITPYYNALLLNYVMASTGENGETEFYNVEEYYRLRYSTENNRMYLLDFERTMEEIFRGSGAHLMGDALQLGIRDMDVSYMANENATIISFVQAGDLWSYNSNTNQLSMVYSFRGIEGINDRENNPSHDIRIIRVSEDGNIDFVVYGYMNRGIHEGYTGIGVYHYNSVANTVQEELFLQSEEAYQVMKETWGQLFYVNAESSFYILAQDTLYRIRLDTSETSTLCSGLSEGRFAVSDDGRYIAWIENGSENVITVMDLDSESSWQVTGGTGTMLRPIGFVESDFVYGIANVADIAEEAGFPMYKIEIMDKEQQVIKEYEKPGYYIMSAYVEDATVILERAARIGNAYVEMESDAIMSHEIEAAQIIHIETVNTEQKQAQVRLVLAQELPKKAPQVLTPQEVVLEKQIEAELSREAAEEYYLVYLAGKVILRTANVSEAVQTADAFAGVVIGADGGYIWHRGTQTGVSGRDRVVLNDADAQGLADPEARCLAALLQAENMNYDVEGLISNGESVAHILQESMPNARVLTLRGCTLSQVLFYIDRGGLVFARGEDQEPVLIVGFDQYNAILYDPVTNTIYRKGLQDSETFFSAGGSSYIAYLKNGSASAP